MSDNLLPDHIWQFIGFKLDSVPDRIRFRAVSKSWNSLLPARLPPWLALSGEGENQEIDGQEQEQKQKHVSLTPPCRGFVSLGDARIYEIDCPQLHQARMIGSSGNWLITVDTDISLRLVNPFTKQVMLLPPSLSLDYANIRADLPPNSYRDVFMCKVVLSSPPSEPQGPPHDFIAVVIYDFGRLLAFTRPGDDCWTPFQTPHRPELQKLKIEDVVFYKKQFYAVDRRGRLMVCDLGDNDSNHPPRLWYLNDGVQLGYRFQSVYLVEWARQLLLVIRKAQIFEDPYAYKTKCFRLYKLDSENRWNEIKSLGEYSLFLGYNTSISLLASDYCGLMKRNSIYFTNNCVFGYRAYQIPRGRDMGVYDLEDGTITPHFKGVSTSMSSPPVWIIPP